MFMFAIRVCGSCLVFRFWIQVWDSGLGFRFGFRLGIRVWDSCSRFWFGIQVLYSDGGFRVKIQVRD